MINKRVVVVDNEEDYVILVADLLRANGYEVLIANDGSDALAKITSEDPWLLILSEHLPDVDGHSLLQMVSQEKSITHLPRVLMLLYTNGRGDGSFWNFPKALPVDMYLSKPFNPVEFCSFIHILREVAIQKDPNDG